MNKLVLPVLLLLAVVAATLLQAARRDAGQSRKSTFRPRARPGHAGWAGQPAADVDVDTVQVLSLRELAGLRDAYSSAPIDPGQTLRCCCGCQALYHATSLEALRVENAGRCAVCGGTAFAPVRLAD